MDIIFVFGTKVPGSNPGEGILDHFIFKVFIVLYKNMKKNLFLAILIFSFLLPLSIKAGGLVPCGGPGEDVCTLCHLFVMFQGWVNAILFIVIPPMAILMIAIGGFMLLISHAGGVISTGEGKKGGPALVAQAKKLFTSVAIGLLLVYGAWIIVNTFLGWIGINQSNDFKGLPQNWWKIDCDGSGSSSLNPTNPIKPQTSKKCPISTPSGGNNSCDQDQVNQNCKDGYCAQSNINCIATVGTSRTIRRYTCYPDQGWFQQGSGECIKPTSMNGQACETDYVDQRCSSIACPPLMLVVCGNTAYRCSTDADGYGRWIIKP